MKKFLTLALIAGIALVSCSKSDDTQKSDNIDNQEIKKIKEVQITFLREEYDFNANHQNSELPYKYTLANETISYEYDTEGRISKIITKEEGGEEKVYQITYATNKIIATFDKEKIEIPLNNKGYLSSTNVPYFYDEKGQLSIAEERFHWENGNLVQIIDRREKDDENIITKLTYYANENKNKFFIYNIEGDLVNAYMSYFQIQKLFPIGVPSKNLVKTFETTYENKDYFTGKTTLTTSFDYIYDADGYVTEIKENRKGIERMGMSSGNYYGSLKVQEMEQLMRDIDNGTVKNKTYKVHQNDNGVYLFDIIHSYHITKDTNGKAIDVKYEIFKSHKFTYTEQNGVRNYDSYQETRLNNRDASTMYKIIYQ